MADFDLSRSSNRARFAWGKLRSLPTKARPIISLDPVEARKTQVKLGKTTGKKSNVEKNSYPIDCRERQGFQWCTFLEYPWEYRM